MHLEVCAFSGSAAQFVMDRTKWLATYTQYFALGMQLPPALLLFHFGHSYAQKNKVKCMGIYIYIYITKIYRSFSCEFLINF